MRCSSRSTTWRGSVGPLTLAAWTLAGAVGLDAEQAAMAADPRVAKAIVEAVQGRMGASTTVAVERLQATLSSGFAGSLIARPEPGARLGRTTRFTLVARQPGALGQPAVRVGAATAIVFASLVHARAAREIEPGVSLGADDLVATAGEVGAVAMAPLPVAADLIGCRVRRPVAGGEVLTATVVAERPIVGAGDRVEVRALAGNVEVTAEAVAAQAGRRGQTIRVVNPESRRAIRARVVGPGQVEVVR